MASIDLSKLKKEDYVKIDQHDAYDFYRSKGTSRPKYIAVIARGTPYKYYVTRGINVYFKVTMGIDSSPYELRILVDEMLDGVYGPPAVTGYGLGGWPPEETYRGIRIGKFRRRDLTENLPSYLAMWTMDGERVQIEEYSIPDLKRAIDKKLDVKM